MNGHGESDRVVVPEKPPNKEERAGEVSVNESAEEVEERTLAKENSRQQNTHRTQRRERVHSALARVRRAASSGSASSSEAGAQCGSSARWDLCGGRPVRAVPTATACTFSRSSMSNVCSPLSRDTPRFLGRAGSS